MKDARIPEVMVPKTLTWDKLTALYIYVVYHLKLALSEVVVRFEDEFPDHGSIPEGVYDLDVVRKYNADGRCGSATQRVVQECGLAAIPGMAELVEVLNENNRTGFLKNRPNSLVWLLREVYEAGHNVPFSEHRMNVVRMFWPVQEAYFQAAREHDDMVQQPLTLDGYAALLQLNGCPAEEIAERRSQLEREFERARNGRERAREKVESIQPTRTFWISLYQSSKSAEAHLIQTDDQRLPREYLREHMVPLLVVRKRSGNYAIFVRGHQDLLPLYQALVALEPGIWFHDTRPDSPLLLNGSSSRMAPTSKLVPAQLIELIQGNYLHRTRRFQEKLRQRSGR
ncbi:MAG: hypothetical protein PHH01_00940 [Patescibacteria group bacterium]|nr:hypothetical protein [Patescibacteria group bacterium]